jgi:flagellar biosynthesis/type III secretory pathway M-ring protein FliF/YscJ
MLDEMEDDLETATANLSLVTLKTKELIQKSGGKRNFILIVMLTVIVIVLLFLVIYT